MKSMLKIFTERFNQHTSEYIKTDHAGQRMNCELKIRHTHRVVREADMIAGALELNEKDRFLAHITALFHDIGRFEQYRIYRTFRDSISVSHAKLGIQMIEERNLLEGLTDSERAIVTEAIRCHNLAEIPETVTDPVILLHARLIRDADKLDILHLITDYYHDQDAPRNPELEIGLPDTPGISEQVREDILAEHIVYISHLKNLNDFKLLQGAWIYDINFRPALEAVRNREYLDKIEAAASPESAALFRHLKTALESRCRQ